MTISPNALLVEQAKIVVGLPPRTPSTSVPDYVTLEGAEKIAIVIVVDNGSTVTGSAITLKQNTVNTVSGEQALAFTSVWANTDIDASDTLVRTAVSNNTFTTDTTDTKNLLYVIEVDANDLTDGYSWIRCGTADGANTVLSVLYILYPARFAAGTLPTVIA